MKRVETGKGKDLDYRVLSSINEIKLPALRDLYKYWLSIKLDREAPEPSDFDLLDVPDIIPICGILEVVDDGQDFRIKFLGQGYTIMTKKDETGKLLSGVDNDVFARRSRDILKLATHTRLPVINGLRAPSIKLVEADIIQSLALPLVRNGAVEELAFAIAVPDLD